MTSKMFLVVLTIACIFASSEAEKDERPAIKQGLVDFYDCSGKTDGNYIHPTDCTKFISCVGKTHAYEMDCPLNNDNTPLHYHQPEDRCERPEVAGCVTDPGTGEPEDCNPKDCTVDGHCGYYWGCVEDKDTGKWNLRNSTCPDGLYFNPTRNSVHGGVCDLPEELPENLREECLPTPPTTTPEPTTPAPPKCYYEGLNCSAEYVFHDLDGVSTRLRCSDGLLWNQAIETCDRPWNVVDDEENACASAPSAGTGGDGTTVEFSCVDRADGLFEFNYDCRRFWKCLQGSSTLYDCPVAHVFNSKTYSCVPHEEGKQFCTSGEF